VSFNGTCVGLDVHALSVVAHAVDEQTGQVERARLCPDHSEIPGWLAQLHGPVRVAYEAGPTGSGWPAPWPKPTSNARSRRPRN
jgi:transposase